MPHNIVLTQKSNSLKWAEWLDSLLDDLEDSPQFYQQTPSGPTVWRCRTVIWRRGKHRGKFLPQITHIYWLTWKINSQFKKNVVRLLLKEAKEKDPSCYNLFEGSQLSASVGEIFWEKTVQFDQRQVEWFICQSSVSSPPDHCER